MDPATEIRKAQEADLVDEDGDEVTLELEPGLSGAEIDELEREVGLPLPRELRNLLAHTAAVDGSAVEIDFTGRAFSYFAEELFPSGVPIAHDGFGNHWIVDVTPEDVDTAPVFFVCHDAPVILYQSPNLAHFLHETFRMSMPPHNSLVDDVHEDRLFKVWRQNPGTLDRAAALAADEHLRAFAEELDDSWTFVDLREPQIGMGFSWGRYGPTTELRRHGYHRLFAYTRPEKKPGLLRRVFG